MPGASDCLQRFTSRFTGDRWAYYHTTACAGSWTACGSGFHGETFCFRRFGSLNIHRSWASTRMSPFMYRPASGKPLQRRFQVGWEFPPPRTLRHEQAASGPSPLGFREPMAPLGCSTASTTSKHASGICSRAERPTVDAEVDKAGFMGSGPELPISLGSQPAPGGRQQVFQTRKHLAGRPQSEQRPVRLTVQ